MFTVKHCHRQVVNTYGMALIRPWKSHQSTSSKRAPAGLQKCVQACFHACLVTSMTPVPTRDRVRLAMQPQPSENALCCHSQCLSMWGTMDGPLEPSRGVTAHDANTWLQNHFFFMWIPTCKVTREATYPINGCYLQQGCPIKLSDGDILSLSCPKRQSLATCDYLQNIKDRKYDQRTESYLGLI